MFSGQPPPMRLSPCKERLIMRPPLTPSATFTPRPAPYPDTRQRYANGHLALQAYEVAEIERRWPMWVRMACIAITSALVWGAIIFTCIAVAAIIRYPV